nr:30S ribosomal protein S2 [Candidatus Gracilibacteria bacterium]
MEREVLKSMFDNLLHIGNKVNFWNPRMKPYIYGATNGIHVINLVKTAEKIEEVKARLNEVTKSGKKVLFVATRLQAKDAFQKLAIDTGNFYVSEKWVPGLLTNFKTIRRRIGTYLKLLKDQELGEFETLTKKEKASRLLELDKLSKAYGGLKEMKKLPELIFVVDGVYESQAIKEANSLNIECISILNSNGDDIVVSNCIPANTNSPKSLLFIANSLKSSIVVGAVPTTQDRTNEGVKVKKIEDKKISGEKKSFKKPETKTEEVKTEPKAKKATKTEEVEA